MAKPKSKSKSKRKEVSNEWRVLFPGDKNWKRTYQRILDLPEPKDRPPVPPAGGKVDAAFILKCLPRRSRSQITPDRVNHWVEQFAHRRIKTTADVEKFIDDLWNGQNGLSRWTIRKLKKKWEKILAATGSFFREHWGGRSNQQETD
jgi:hypothetical protein